MHHIVILDSSTANPGDLSWDFLKKYGTLEIFGRSTPAETAERAKNADIVIINKTVLSESTLRRLPKLKFITLLATGFNVVDTAAADKLGITVSNVPSYSTDAVAQQTFAFILEFANRVGIHSERVHCGEWVNCPDFSFIATPLCELKDKTIGIIGYGRIGRRVAEIAHAFGMKVIVNTAHPEKYSDSAASFMSLDEMLPKCDFVTVHCPLTPQTDKLVNADFVAKMKDGAFLINTSRGAELDEHAVADALNSGKLAGAGLDVLTTEPPLADNPLLKAKNAWITPHIAWAPFETRERLLGVTEENIKAFCDGAPVNVVNHPSVIK